MKTSLQPKRIHSHHSLSRLRLPAVAVLVLAGAALAYIGTVPTLPWAVPTVSVGNIPVFDVVDQATNTIYVANGADGTVSVIDGRRCNSSNSSRCSPIATLTVGPIPLFMAFDLRTSTLYVVIAGGAGNTIAVVNANTCNARNTSGCGQTPAVVTVPGAFFNPDLGQASNIVLDTASHTLYVGDANEGPVSFLDTATCNGTNTAGCSQPLVTTATNGDSLTIDHTNHSVYVTVFADGTFSVFNAATCNAVDTSGCSQTAGAFPINGVLGAPGAVDESTHTVYLPVGGSGALDHVAMIDGSTCNGTVSSGCGNTPPMVQVGDNPVEVVIDPTTRTLFVVNQGSASISVINAATCNATNQSGCTPAPLPALAIGIDGFGLGINLNTHTLYAVSQDLNNVWVLNAATCNATRTSGCTQFAPTTTIGHSPGGIAANPNTQTAYVINQDDNTVSVIDTTVCNASTTSGCNQSWPTVNVGNFPRFIGINKITNTIYVSNAFDNTIGVINGATCNRSTTAGCTQVATTPGGARPLGIAVDEATNTIYVANRHDNTVSVINGAVCNATNTLGCSRHWLTVSVGHSPVELALNTANHTLYVSNVDDATVSVINGNTCNGTTPSGCSQRPPTISVGLVPWGVGVDPGTNTVFVGNLVDLTVSVIDGSTCNATNRSGCGQVPPAVIVGAFPSTAGNNENVLGQTVLVDPATHKVYIPTSGDDDVAVIDGSTCTGSNTSHCQASIVPLRMGGFATIAAVDDSSGTVYVANNDDGTVSLFAK